MLYATHAVVRLDNIHRNLAGIRAHVGAERKVLIAVKANGYGHGAVAVSRMAQETGAADWLGVATVPEGIELREAGITLPILKLSHTFDAEETRAAIEHGITLAVSGGDSAALVARVAAELGREARVHLKVDTGMRRIGSEPDASPEVARALEDAPYVVLEGMFTHLPVSDAPAADDFTEAQIGRFFDTVDAVQRELGRELDLVHCANSGGVLGHPSALGEGRIDPGHVMVRPGIMIYGYYPDATTPHTIALHPGIEFKTAVSYVKPVAAGETVGYGRTWTAPRDTLIATIPVGYADGFSRLNSNRGRVLIGGRSYPIVGRVCMDQSMVDLGAGEDGVVVKPGDEVVLIGRQGDQEITCDEIATLMDTITYEVTCLLTPRVSRLYAQVAR